MMKVYQNLEFEFESLFKTTTFSPSLDQGNGTRTRGLQSDLVAVRKTRGTSFTRIYFGDGEMERERGNAELPCGDATVCCILASAMRSFDKGRNAI